MSKDFIDRIPPKAALTKILSALKWDSDGLIAVIQQDVKTKQVVGLAFTDITALKRTFKTGLMHYYSRSRQKLWMKGEESGHIQKLVELRIDCDGDALLAHITQVKANCHMGFFSCFSTAVKKQRDGKWSVKIIEKKRFDPKTVYGKKA
jgi:phosphoribosyl-AMP cyclohydrolase